jgi:hypothetical protein
MGGRQRLQASDIQCCASVLLYGWHGEFAGPAVKAGGKQCMALRCPMCLQERALLDTCVEAASALAGHRGKAPKHRTSALLALAPILLHLWLLLLLLFVGSCT